MAYDDEPGGGRSKIIIALASPAEEKKMPMIVRLERKDDKWEIAE